MQDRIIVVSNIGGKEYKTEYRVLYRDHSVLIVERAAGKFTEISIFYATANSDGFNVVLPGESIRVNMCEPAIVPVAVGRYIKAADGSHSIELEPTFVPRKGKKPGFSAAGARKKR